MVSQPASSFVQLQEATGGDSSHCAVQTLRVPTSITEQEEVQVEVTRLLVECYFDIVRANLQVCYLTAQMNQPLLRSPPCIVFQTLYCCPVHGSPKRPLSQHCGAYPPDEGLLLAGSQLGLSTESGTVY